MDEPKIQKNLCPLSWKVLFVIYLKGRSVGLYGLLPALPAAHVLGDLRVKVPYLSVDAGPKNEVLLQGQDPLVDAQGLIVRFDGICRVQSSTPHFVS